MEVRIKRFDMYLNILYKIRTYQKGVDKLHNGYHVGENLITVMLSFYHFPCKAHDVSSQFLVFVLLQLRHLSRIIRLRLKPLLDKLDFLTLCKAQSSFRHSLTSSWLSQQHQRQKSRIAFLRDSFFLGALGKPSFFSRANLKRSRNISFLDGLNVGTSSVTSS